MLKNSDIWTVRSYINQHTCSVVTRTLPDRDGDEDGTENDATGDEGTGGVLTFHGDIEMHENFTERDEHVFEDTEVRPRVVYQPQDDDRNKSLIKSVRLVFPEAEHGYCITKILVRSSLENAHTLIRMLSSSTFIMLFAGSILVQQCILTKVQKMLKQRKYFLQILKRRKENHNKQDFHQ
ncbi:hypothetical protein YC2023_077067 [Brassica napus]